MSLRGHKTVATPVSTGIRLLVADCGNTYLAVPADVIRGILKPEQVSGNDVLSFLGVSYPRVDLAGRFGLRRKVSGTEARLILCSEGNRHCAFQVDQVIGLIEVGRPSMLPLPAQFRGEERRWFGGLFLFRETVALVLNSRWILEESRRASTGNQPDAALTSSCATPSLVGIRLPIGHEARQSRV